MIRNPILRGFNPDPSIVRVGSDYYIATSTFEWFPGVQIHHSKDLVSWRLLTRPLDRQSQLDMTGVPDSGGVWAPCLSWYDGVFYLAYTNAHALNTITKDTPNFLVTAESILGPWSEPVYLCSHGFDPSLFHDEDGRRWLVYMVWDHRPGKSRFYGIGIQEYCVRSCMLLGSCEMIFKGTELGCTEGPHLYRRNGYYYLLTAEGGTGWEHAVTIARSRDLMGPYEVHPSNPLLTSHGDPGLELQKAGHADLVETEDGEWFLVHLCSRPLPGLNRCTLGRETAIQRIEWGDDDWPYLSGGGNRPRVTVAAPDLPSHPWPRPAACDHFDHPQLRLEYQTPRTPLDVRDYSLSERPGSLRLYGGESMQSRFNQVIVARRLEEHRVEVTTVLELAPQSFQQMAGLVCYYSTRLYHYLFMSLDESLGCCLYVQSADEGEVSYPSGDEPVALGSSHRVWLRARIDGGSLRFFYSLDGEIWSGVGGELDMSLLSDDHGADWGFTGAFVGMACQDLTGTRRHADFDLFEYRELEP